MTLSRLPVLLALATLLAAPVAAQGGSARPVSGAEATDALAEAMRARGLTPAA